MARKKKVKSKESGRGAELDLALEGVRKKYGAILRWLSEEPEESIDFISTGSISLDHALGGGFPRGRMVEVFGWEGCGKSTLAMSTVAEANKLGLDAVYLDVERALDPRLPIAYGVDPERFLLEDAPISAEEHLEIMESLISSGKIGVCVLDSITALQPKAELEGNIGDAHVGIQARLLSQACRKLIQLLGETNTLMIFINQFREKIQKGGFQGDPRVVSGGNATKFYCTHRVEISGSAKTKGARILGSDGEIVGHKMGYKVIKNKLGAPWRTGTLDLIYGQGYDIFSELVDLCVDLALIEVKGSWYVYDKGDAKAQGSTGFRNLLMENHKLKEEMQTQVKSLLGMGM